MVPDDVGGRYSVLTAVGLLPIAVAGIDIDDSAEKAEAEEAVARLKNAYPDLKINVAERKAVRILGIFEAHALEPHRAVGDRRHGIFGVFHRRCLVKHLADTLCRFCRHRNHHVDHRNHHQGHQNLYAIG